MPQSAFLRPVILAAISAALGQGLPAVAAVMPAPAPAVAPTPAPAVVKAPPPNYNAIYEKNIFDPQRKQWEEKKEVPPPLPPLTAEDVQIYGVMAVGSYKRAIVKLAGKLRGLAPTDPKSRQFVTLSEGQSLAGYTLAEIGPQRLVFSVGDVRYAVAFNKKEDRPLAPPPPAPAAFQDAVVVTAETPNGANGQPLPTSSPSGQDVVQAVAAAATPAAPEPAPAPAAPAAEAPAPNASANAGSNAAAPAAPSQSMSLLEAIQQAQQAKAQGGGQAAAVTNPFGNLNK